MCCNFAGACQCTCQRDVGDDRDFMTALNKVDRSALRDMLTERMLSRFKSHLPDKKELTKAKKSGHLLSLPAFVTGACSIVQARAVQIAHPVDTVFVQVTCEISVLQPEKDLVRVVFERPLALVSASAVVPGGDSGGVSRIMWYAHVR